MIKFIAEYTDGTYCYLALETGDHPTAYCTEQGCMNTPNSTLYDVEGDPMLFCGYHIQRLDQDTETGWTRGSKDGLLPAEIVAGWIVNNPEMFVEVVEIPIKDLEEEDGMADRKRDREARKAQERDAVWSAADRAQSKRELESYQESAGYSIPTD
jgi:hypothetical protein